MQSTAVETTHENLADEMDRCGADGWAYRVRELGTKQAKMKLALQKIYLEDIFDDTMRQIAKDALGL